MVTNIADLIAKGQYTSSLSYWAVRVIAVCDRIAALELGTLLLLLFCCFPLSLNQKNLETHSDLIFKKLQLSKISSILLRLIY